MTFHVAIFIILLFWKSECWDAVFGMVGKRATGQLPETIEFQVHQGKTGFRTKVILVA